MAEDQQPAPPSSQKGGSGLLIFIFIVVLLFLPLGSLAIGIAIIPQGASLVAVQGAGALANISGTGCAHYTGTKLTAYWTPNEWSDYGGDTKVRQMEGGPLDRRKTRNQTLHEYIQGKYIDPANPLKNYVSLAGDYTDGSPVSTYGTKVYIPSIEQALNGGKEIIFRVVDTGGDFIGKKATRLDVAVLTKGEMSQSVLNATTDIYVGDGCRHDALSSS